MQVRPRGGGFKEEEEGVEEGGFVWISCEEGDKMFVFCFCSFLTIFLLLSCTLPIFPLSIFPLFLSAPTGNDNNYNGVFFAFDVKTQLLWMARIDNSIAEAVDCRLSHMGITPESFFSVEYQKEGV